MSNHFLLVKNSDPSIWSLIESYRDLVNDCAQGYTWTSNELNNELSIRDKIDTLAQGMNSDRDVMEDIANQIKIIDDKLRSLFQDDVLLSEKMGKWYRRGILKFAGAEYVDCMKTKGFIVKLSI